MREAITDTGPVLHLHEIGQLESLRIFERLVMPDLVAEELCNYGLDPSHLDVTALKVTIVIVERTEWSPVLSEADQPTIHPADAQVFVLARSSQFQKPVLTDDLALPLADGTAEARPLSDELIANYGPDGRLAGLEILDAGQVLGQVEGRIVFEIAPALAAAVPYKGTHRLARLVANGCK